MTTRAGLRADSQVDAIPLEEQAQQIVNGKKAVVLLVACSNTAAGAKFRALKALALQLVNGLRDGQRFTILAFGAGVLSFDDVLHAASPKTKELAETFLGCLELLGHADLDHALMRAQRLAVGQDAQIALLAAHAAEYTGIYDLTSSATARITHVIEYDGHGQSPLTALARTTGGTYMAIAAPAETSAVAPEQLPRKYACCGTALLRLPRPEARCSPEWLTEQLQQQSIGSLALVVDKSICAGFSAAVAELRDAGIDDGLLKTTFELALHNLQQIGGLSWLRQVAVPPALIDRRAYLELRILAIQCCRDWCHQELVFNPSYNAESLPKFIRSN